ncbi:MAG: hypothetical protein WCA35_27845 [Kovacikia sp.]
MVSKNKFGTILGHFSDQVNCQELLIPLGVRVSEPMNFEFRIANWQQLRFPKTETEKSIPG